MTEAIGYSLSHSAGTNGPCPALTPPPARPTPPPMLRIEGHAIVSADGMIADATGEVPSTLRNDADWAQYQAALERAAVTVTGRVGHERFRNPGRRRLVLTRRVTTMAPDPRDPQATFWNPANMTFDAVLAALGIAEGTVAITAVFDLFLPVMSHFQLSESHRLLLHGGIPCFTAGHPRAVLADAGLVPGDLIMLDPDTAVTTTLWSRHIATA